MRRVVVLGAGVAGYNATRELTKGLMDREEVELTLISQHPHFLVRPLLPEVAAGWTNPQFAIVELMELQNIGPISIHTERVLDIDLPSNRVVTDRTAYSFDYLLIALGCGAFPPEAWSPHEHVYSLANDIEAARLRHRLSRLAGEENFEDVTIAIAGGGPTGVDFAATLAERYQSTVAPRIVIFEARQRLLPSFPSSFSDYAEQCLRRLNVEVVSDVTVDLDGHRLEGAGHTYDPDVIVWTGTPEVSAILDRVDTATRAGRLVIDDFLRLPDRPDVFAAGAAVFLPDDLQLGFSATARMGRTAARNLLAAMAGRAPDELSLDPHAQMVSLGQRRAIAQPFGVPVFGRAAWAMYRLALMRAVPDLVTQVEIVGSWAQQWLNDTLGS